MTEYFLIFKKNSIESEFMPNVEKFLKKTLDPVFADEMRIKMTKLSGKIIDKLAKCHLT